MHIPDGFLDARTAAATGLLAAAGLGLALRRARAHLPPRRVPLLGLTAAFVFAAQMLNFPVAGGVSGHLTGGVLAAALLGPSAAVVVLSAVLIVQCLLFADGGVTALGANIFNIALVGGVAGGAIYRLLSKAAPGLTGRVAAAAFAGWAGTVLAAVACAGELAASGAVEWSIGVRTLVGVHALIGVGEGLITALVVAAIGKARPELLSLGPGGPPVGARGAGDRWGAVALGLVVCLGLALFVAPFASPWPDGLDKAAEVLGFKDREASERLVPALAPDYELPGVGSGGVATALAGAVGTLTVFAAAWLLARVLVPRTKADGTPDAVTAGSATEGG